MNRRYFLKVAGTLGGGLLVSGFLAGKEKKPAFAETAADSPWFFIELKPDGGLHLRLGKQEMGQGAPSGVAMLFAEELGMDWESVTVDQMELSAATSAFYQTPQGSVTGGSWTVSSLWEPMRLAGASVREMLIQVAAERLQVEPKSLEAENGAVVSVAMGVRIPFHELAAAAAQREVPAEPRLRDPASFKIIGKPKPNARSFELSTGRVPYSINKRLPGMRHAAIARCPVWGGRLLGFNADAALERPGVEAVFRIEAPEGITNPYQYYKPGVAVVADSTWNAFKACELLEITWEEGNNSNVNMDTLRQRIARKEFLKTELPSDWGDPETVLQAAAVTHEAVYETHFQPHAPMEPLNATATADGDSIVIWTSSQDIKRCCDSVAAALGIPVDKIVMHSCPCGGSFGRRSAVDYVVEAALIAHRLQGPVKLTWSREDDIAHDLFHPYERSVWKAGLDRKGDLSALAASYAITGSPDYWWLLHGGFMPYGLKDWKVEGNLLDHPVPTGAWRSVVEHIGAFPEESFIDEMAHLAGRDPLAFRLEQARKAVEQHGQDDYWGSILARVVRLFEKVEVTLDWRSPLPPNQGRGIALSKFGSTVVAQVAEVEVWEGDFRVNKVEVFVGAGLIVNPQLAENQIEGAVVWALSALKHGRFTLENGRILESNFDQFELLRMNEAPEIRVHFLQDDGPMGGIGEPGVPALAPAVLNAIFAATGRRLRNLPIESSALL
ncbi:xanthine dehydrogenase family protein molybdopterin-binding subunit [Pelagicoccus sp. NFK12]|uniref:Xanthine dehydrogenase family protein molybdopterin-binding subunit n=1 Tax=Pelagicoccus enzymogenes TaxID=2773457 RepID=A0A927F4X7_9BACT|nr:molybdopterin cofactor-binding domain-containing protein [Pelagicoccus enzymogenes]MBD5778135.1 xanthine dehydrogenase family protein molybdopterin-binding subunit [Pelagicoccus enzymogenes]